jgi:DNA-binding PadR family transcriptional regulator
VRAAILVLLGEGPRNGYQLMQELEQRSRGAWRPSPGSVYPALAQLEDEGLVRSEASGPGKTYHLTDAGQDYVHERAEELSAPYPWEHVTDEDEHAQREEVAATMMQLAAAFRQVVHTGSPQQVEAARRLLDETRANLYRILAGDRAGASPKERK